MTISRLSHAPLRATVTPAPAAAPAEAAPEPRDSSVLGRAVRGLHRGTLAALGWTVGSAVGVIGFVGNLAPGAFMGIRRALGDFSSSEFYTRSDRSDRWVMAKFAQTALIGAAAGAIVGVNPILGAVVGALLRAPLHGLASHRHLDYAMNMAVEEKVSRGNVLVGAAQGALAAGVTGWKSGLNNVRSLVNGLAGTGEERDRGVDLLYWDLQREMSAEGRADHYRARLAEPGLTPSQRTRFLEKAQKHTAAIYESSNTFISRDDQKRITVRAWAAGLRAAPGWAQRVKAEDEDLLRIHGTLTERIDADRAYPAFERFLRRRDDVDAALRDFAEAETRMLAGESLDEATLDRDTRAILGVDAPARRGEVVPEGDRVKVGEIWLPTRG